MIFAYTVKGHGWRLPGDPLNHSQLFSRQMDELREVLGHHEDEIWSTFDQSSDAGKWCRSCCAIASPAQSQAGPLVDPAVVPLQSLIHAIPK